MQERYRDYLMSEAWMKKRRERLNISNGRCSACGKTSGVEVHHLTYDRIFNEEMSDLIPLCRKHHQAIEDLIKSGQLTRHGEVLFLSSETIRLVLSYEKMKKSSKRFKELDVKAFIPSHINHSKTIQHWLTQQPGFKETVLQSRDLSEFKRKIRVLFGKDFINRGKNNACAIYSRYKRIGFMLHGQNNL